jgi:hypothetical protein
MGAEALVKDVEEVETRSGKTRYLVRDEEGRESRRSDTDRS